MAVGSVAEWLGWLGSVAEGRPGACWFGRCWCGESWFGRCWCGGSWFAAESLPCWCSWAGPFVGTDPPSSWQYRRSNVPALRVVPTRPAPTRLNRSRVWLWSRIGGNGDHNHTLERFTRWTGRPLPASDHIVDASGRGRGDAVGSERIESAQLRDEEMRHDVALRRRPEVHRLCPPGAPGEYLLAG